MANGKQLSQKGADFILDLMDSYIDVKEAVTPCVVRGGERMTEEELEKEKCELLGIIQGKDKAIADLKKENAAYRDISESKIENLKDDVRALRKQIAKMRNCENCQTVRDANGNCYLHKDGKCDPKTKIKWEIKK